MTTDTVDEEPRSSTFLTGLAFLTGEDPNAGSFLLVVGLVTCLFIAAFQFLLQAPVSNLLTAFVLVIAVISFLMGAILDILGYFDTPMDGD
ncbi:hypothetical protein [Haloarcula halophila]|uniref:hypothetical protein n=1 Tax=Haloarcula TaxID=2237 RepID=UPI0023E46BC6|nr:hypothetical protein [Halomicroarcula sp. DFY41]